MPKETEQNDDSVDNEEEAEEESEEEAEEDNSFVELYFQPKYQ